MAYGDIKKHGPANRLVLAILREYFASQTIHVGTLYSDENPTPMILVSSERRNFSGTAAKVDERFLRTATITVNVLASGVDADTDCEQIHEACHAALMRSFLDQKTYPGLGSISRIENPQAAARVSDWATSSGVVQYATLPQGVVRYEAVYRLVVTPPNQSTITNPFIAPDL